MAPPPHESGISLIVEMGFSREREQESLRYVESNNVEISMEWLFYHPKEHRQESGDLAQFVALSLVSSMESPRDDTSVTDAQSRVIFLESPQVEYILATSIKLLQIKDLLEFCLTELIVILCKKNKGQDRLRLVSHITQKLNIFKIGNPAIDSGPISTISHILHLVLAKEGSERKIPIDNEIVIITLNILMKFNIMNVAGGNISVSKWVTALLLELDHML